MAERLALSINLDQFLIALEIIISPTTNAKQSKSQLGGAYYASTDLLLPFSGKRSQVFLSRRRRPLRRYSDRIVPLRAAPLQPQKAQARAQLRDGARAASGRQRSLASERR